MDNRQKLQNNFSMLRYNGPQIARPRTMAELRSRENYNKEGSRNQTYRNPEKQTVEYNDDKGHLAYHTERNPQINQRYVCLAVPKEVEYSDSLLGMRKKNNIYSRENIQIMNKKYREIRSSRMSPSLGLYDLQNDRRQLPTRDYSASGPYADTLLSTEMKPFAQSMKKLQKKPASSIKIRRTHKEQLVHGQIEPQDGEVILRAKSAAKITRQMNQIGDKRQIILREKQSQNGYVVHKFESRMKKKCMEDNLHVMATLLRRKVKALDKKEMMIYLSRLMNRNTIEK